jgi:hypothetical protein
LAERGEPDERKDIELFREGLTRNIPVAGGLKSAQIVYPDDLSNQRGSNQILPAPDKTKNP